MASLDFAFKCLAGWGACVLAFAVLCGCVEEALATHEATLRDLEVYQFTQILIDNGAQERCGSAAGGEQITNE